MTHLSGLAIAVLLAACVFLLSWGVSFVPLPWNEMVRDAMRFTFLVLLVWLARRGLAYERELDEHRKEIVDALNHRLVDLENLKKTAAALEQHNTRRADSLVAETKKLADQVAEDVRQRADALVAETKRLAEQSAEESRQRHEAIGIKLDQVIRDKATKAVTEETHELVKDLADKPKE